MRRLLPLLTGLLAFADGGKVILERNAGAFAVTLFSSPATVRAGRGDFSVMVRNTADRNPVLDASVRLHFTQRDKNSISEVSVAARRELAANKLLYAAQADLNATGKWRVEITVQNGHDSALVTGDIDVAAPQPPLLAYWPYLAVLPVVALLFAANQRLKRRRRAPNPQ